MSRKALSLKTNKLQSTMDCWELVGLIRREMVTFRNPQLVSTIIGDQLNETESAVIEDKQTSRRWIAGNWYA